MIENILNRLTKVKKSGQDNWIACCPAHDDHKPSLAIKYATDGKILIKCWSGCQPGEILGALGLTFLDLFPDSINYAMKPGVRNFPASQMLALIGREATIVALCGSKRAEGDLSEADRARLFVAVGRINWAMDQAGVRHDA
jgi:hypothetical protein